VWCHQCSDAGQFGVIYAYMDARQHIINIWMLGSMRSSFMHGYWAAWCYQCTEAGQRVIDEEARMLGSLVSFTLIAVFQFIFQNPFFPSFGEIPIAPPGWK
jgi:hypothetical protein